MWQLQSSRCIQHNNDIKFHYFQCYQKWDDTMAPESKAAYVIIQCH